MTDHAIGDDFLANSAASNAERSMCEKASDNFRAELFNNSSIQKSQTRPDISGVPTTPDERYRDENRGWRCPDMVPPPPVERSKDDANGSRCPEIDRVPAPPVDRIRDDGNGSRCPDIDRVPAPPVERPEDGSNNGSRDPDIHRLLNIGNELPSGQYESHPISRPELLKLVDEKKLSQLAGSINEGKGFEQLEKITADVFKKGGNNAVDALVKELNQQLEKMHSKFSLEHNVGTFHNACSGFGLESGTYAQNQITLKEMGSLVSLGFELEPLRPVGGPFDRETPPELPDRLRNSFPGTSMPENNYEQQHRTGRDQIAAGQLGDKPGDPFEDLTSRQYGADMQRYEERLEAWKPENYAHKLAQSMKEHGLDEKTMDALRARGEDLDKVLALMNNELKNDAMSLKKSADGQSLILSENGKEKQREFLTGKSTDLSVGGTYTSPEKEAEMAKAAADIAKEILKNGTLSEKSIEELRKQNWNSALYDESTGKRSATLLERVNKLLEAEGLKIKERFSPMDRQPEKPCWPGTPTIGGGVDVNNVYLDLLDCGGQKVGSTYWGTSYMMHPYY